MGRPDVKGVLPLPKQDSNCNGGAQDSTSQLPFERAGFADWPPILGCKRSSMPNTEANRHRGKKYTHIQNKKSNLEQLQIRTNRIGSRPIKAKTAKNNPAVGASTESLKEDICEYCGQRMAFLKRDHLRMVSKSLCL